MPTYKVFYTREEFFTAFLITGMKESLPAVNSNTHRFVAEVAVEDLEGVFREMNVVEGVELPVRLGLRSMSVGDVVLDTEAKKAFIVRSFGFAELPGATFQELNKEVTR